MTDIRTPWQPFETVPKVFGPVLGAMIGADGRWWVEKIWYLNPATAFMSSKQWYADDPGNEWVAGFGLNLLPISQLPKFLYWRPMPEPPYELEHNDRVG